MRATRERGDRSARSDDVRRLPASPPITVVGGRAEADASPAERPGRVTLVVAALGGAAALLAVVEREPPPPVPDAWLRVQAEGISNSFDGVIVVPVELSNRGPRVTLEQVEVAAFPVRQPSSSSGTRHVEPGRLGRFVALVQPDCAALPDPTDLLAATVTVRLRADGGRAHDVALDLGQEPAVAARVARVCRPPVA